MAKPVSEEDALYLKYADLREKVRVRLYPIALVSKSRDDKSLFPYDRRMRLEREEASINNYKNNPDRNQEKLEKQMKELKTKVYTEIQLTRFLNRTAKHFEDLNDLNTFEDFTDWKDQEVDFSKTLKDNLPNLKADLEAIESSIKSITTTKPADTQEKNMMGNFSKFFGRKTNNDDYLKLLEKNKIFLEGLIKDINDLIGIYGDNPLILLTQIIEDRLKTILYFAKKEKDEAKQVLDDLNAKNPKPKHLIEPANQRLEKAVTELESAVAEFKSVVSTEKAEQYLKELKLVPPTPPAETSPAPAEAKGGTLNRKSRRKRILRKNQSKSTHSRKKMLRKTHRKYMHRR
uniref:Uncharacterized protein n=1 Tax=viral metagenome TaxID=1070528 RepID=A0A6C0JIC1_9ZZZZ